MENKLPLLFFIDLDGTLLNSKKKVNNADKECLKKMGEQNICRVIATGRSLFACNEVLKSDIEIDYLIFSNGAGIINWKDKTLLYDKYLSQKETIEIVEKLSDLEIDFQVRQKVPNSHKYFYRRYFRHNPDFDRLNRKYANCVRELKQLNQLQESARVITIAPTVETFELIKSEFAQFEITRVTSPINHRSVWTEIYPKGVNKGTACAFLLSKLKLKFTATAGLGNDYNVIDFLEKVAFPFVVADAPQTMKREYKITVTNNESPLSAIYNYFY